MLGMLVSKTAKVKWHYSNKEYFQDKGYVFTNNLDEFEVSVDELQPKSASIIFVDCDFKQESCKGTYPKKYADYYKNKNGSISDGDCCSNVKCMKVKREQSVIQKYGVSNSNQIPSAKEKRINTCLEKYDATSPLGNKDIWDKINDTNMKKYGVENISQIDSVKEKKVSTFLIRYGNTNPMKTKQFKLKSRNTNLRKYGVEYYTQTEEYKVKTKNTNISKYGVEHLMKLESVVEDRTKKRLVTLYETGNTKSSTQQNYLNRLIGGELNYPVDRSSLDIAFLDEKVYLEYNGSGHWLRVKIGDMTQEEFDKCERNRQYFLKSKGWKLIRFNSRKDLFPSEAILLEIIENAKKYLLENHSWVEIDIDESKINSSQFLIDYDFGKLVKINKKTLTNNAI